MAFFIKIDVEGYEVSVWRGLHSKVPYVSFEVNLPEFLPDELECVEILHQLAQTGKFNYVTGDMQGLVLPQWLDPAQFSKVLA
jgi:hypothetical protein